MYLSVYFWNCSFSLDVMWLAFTSHWSSKMSTTGSINKKGICRSSARFLCFSWIFLLISFANLVSSIWLPKLEIIHMYSRLFSKFIFSYFSRCPSIFSFFIFMTPKGNFHGQMLPDVFSKNSFIPIHQFDQRFVIPNRK